MKKFLPVLAGVLAIAFTQPFATKAQAPCDLKGIYTDPAQPAVNPEYPARTPCLVVQPQMAAADVQAVCTGSVYQTVVALRPVGPAKAGIATANTAAAIGDVQVYPNPATNAATIRFAGTAAGRASAYVTDTFGKQVLPIMQNELVAEGLQEKALIRRACLRACTSA